MTEQVQEQPTQPVKPARETGVYWHIHHEELYEVTIHAQERRDYIESAKPHWERDTRLRLMRPIKGVLGDPEKYALVLEAAKEAGVADEKWKATRGKLNTQAERVASDEAYVDRDKKITHLYDTYDEWAKTVTVADAELLHHQECPNCPWDGMTIFP